MADVLDSNVGSIWEAAVATWDYVTSALSSDDADKTQNSTTAVSNSGTCTEYITDGFRPTIQVTVPCSSTYNGSSIWNDVKSLFTRLGTTQAYWRK